MVEGPRLGLVEDRIPGNIINCEDDRTPVTIIDSLNADRTPTTVINTPDAGRGHTLIIIFSNTDRIPVTQTSNSSRANRALVAINNSSHVHRTPFTIIISLNDARTSAISSSNTVRSATAPYFYGSIILRALKSEEKK